MVLDPEFEVEFPHRIYLNASLQERWDGYSHVKREVREQCRLSKANLISSKIMIGNLHAPLIDLDFPARLVPSSTEGHFHLYLDKTLSWRSYKKLLKALYKAGIIEKGFYKFSKKRKESHLRLPHIKKV